MKKKEGRPTVEEWQIEEKAGLKSGAELCFLQRKERIFQRIRGGLSREKGKFVGKYGNIYILKYHFYNVWCIKIYQQWFIQVIVWVPRFRHNKGLGIQILETSLLRMIYYHCFLLEQKLVSCLIICVEISYVIPKKKKNWLKISNWVYTKSLIKCTCIIHSIYNVIHRLSS